LNDSEGVGVFAEIAGKYDRLNRILSLGQDKRWRRRAIATLPAGRVLDLGAGTGAANDLFGSRQVVALDPSPPMLALNPALKAIGVGERLPFAAGSFDGVFSAFVFRNLESIPATLQELARVLRPGGVVAIVDATRPRGRWKRRLHQLGSAVFVPAVGRMAGAPAEYTYLNQSLDKLPPPEQLYADAPLRLQQVWRMGPLGFVYGAVLRKD
jgi:demethylmenaquinone methyltransferase/2-methoxy-6-polyprenyl-1,4-benzoquinol methylase